MTRDEALLRAIEGDLVHYHRQRMAKRKGELMAILLAEEAKPSPDAKVIEQLRKAMVQAERDTRDESITIREVVEPLRARIEGKG